MIEFVRDFEVTSYDGYPASKITAAGQRAPPTQVTSVGFKRTGRRCSLCTGELRDHCLDWEDALPDDELRRSEVPR